MNGKFVEEKFFSPLGAMTIRAQNGFITNIYFDNQRHLPPVEKADAYSVRKNNYLRRVGKGNIFRQRKKAVRAGRWGSGGTQSCSRHRSLPPGLGMRRRANRIRRRTGPQDSAATYGKRALYRKAERASHIKTYKNKKSRATVQRAAFLLLMQ